MESLLTPPLLDWGCQVPEAVGFANDGSSLAPILWGYQDLGVRVVPRFIFVIHYFVLLLLLRFLLVVTPSI